MSKNLRTSMPDIHPNRAPSQARLRETFLRIAEPCPRSPAVWYDVAKGTRAPWRLLLVYMRQAFDAARTREQRRAVIVAITGFFHECIAHVRLWIVDAPSTRRELFWEAQSSDADEDVCETLYLVDPSPGNAARLIEAGRRERSTSEAREHFLMTLVAGQPRDAA